MILSGVRFASGREELAEALARGRALSYRVCAGYVSPL
jgi:hypothetical protein